MDIAKAANGTVLLPDISSDPKHIRGCGTNFLSPEIMVGGSIYLPTINGDSAKLDIAEILGPHDIMLKKGVESGDAIFQLTGLQSVGTGCALNFEGTSFKVAPYVDQTQVYAAVFDELRAGGCLGIFPEGASHDRTELLPLKGKSTQFFQDLPSYNRQY